MPAALLIRTATDLEAALPRDRLACAEAECDGDLGASSPSGFLDMKALALPVGEVRGINNIVTDRDTGVWRPREAAASATSWWRDRRARGRASSRPPTPQAPGP